MAMSQDYEIDIDEEQ
jgi:hypothetical protein